MRVAWRAALVLAVFAVVGWITSHTVMVHQARQGNGGAEDRMAAWMAGLFAGGGGAAIIGIALVTFRRRR